MFHIGARTHLKTKGAVIAARVDGTTVALKSRIDDGDVLIAFRGVSGIREGPGAAGATISIFGWRTFPNQDSFRFRHAGECTLVGVRLVSLFGHLPAFPRRGLSGLLTTFAHLIQRKG